MSPTFFTVPTILNMLVDHPAVDAHDHSSLKHVIYAGAPMYRDDQKRIVGKLGKCIVQYFGLGGDGLHHGPATRACMMSTIPFQGHIGSCGYPRTAMDVRICDDDGKDARPARPAKSASPARRLRRLFRQSRSKCEGVPRRLVSPARDLGHVDAQGSSISPGALRPTCTYPAAPASSARNRRKLIEHPAVAEAAIVRHARPQMGQTGVAVVALKPGASASRRKSQLSGNQGRPLLPSKIVILGRIAEVGLWQDPQAADQGTVDAGRPGGREAGRMSEAPEGYRPTDHSSPLHGPDRSTLRNGRRRNYRLGMRVGNITNRIGACHGAVLAALADVHLLRVVALTHKPRLTLCDGASRTGLSESGAAQLVDGRTRPDRPHGPCALPFLRHDLRRRQARAAAFVFQIVFRPVEELAADLLAGLWPGSPARAPPESSSAGISFTARCRCTRLFAFEGLTTRF